MGAGLQRGGGGGALAGCRTTPNREVWEIPNTIHRAFLVKKGEYRLINSARNVSVSICAYI